MPDTTDPWALLVLALYDGGYAEMTTAGRICQPHSHGGECDNWPPHECDCWVFEAWRALPPTHKWDGPVSDVEHREEASNAPAPKAPPASPEET